MKINEAFPSNYLKAADLNGRRVPVTISHVKMEQLGKDTKAVVYFVGKEKGVVLNVTNKNMIVAITGSEETDDWQGKKIILHSVKVLFEGVMKDSIRVDFAEGESKPAPVTEDQPF